MIDWAETASTLVTAAVESPSVEGVRQHVVRFAEAVHEGADVLERRPEVGMIQHIEHLGTELQAQRFVDRKLAVNGKVPRLGIVVSVTEAYTQCAKALIRSDLWNPENHIERSELPASGEILRLISLPDLDVDEHERARAERYARGDGLY